ncbi:MAG: ribonuclease III [Nitrospirales bacterium]|nr:ribonuclease III [Nitrospirales bacterium]
MAFLQDVQGALGYTFRSPTLLEEALTHKSHLQDKRTSKAKHNERLEFLGDAVLALVVSEELTERFPAFTEGELSKTRAYLVSKTSLAQAAQRLHIGRFLRLGRGEEVTHGRSKHSLLANALEALIAAIYKDGGLAPAKMFILATLKENMANLPNLTVPDHVQDYKSQLQEWCQHHFNALPQYTVVQEQGPDHQKVFDVVVAIQGNNAGQGKGNTKKEAEQQAAEQALNRLHPI